MRSQNLLLTFVSIFLSSFSYSQTEISGGIYNNTVWSPSGNPYIISGKVTVFEDIELTVLPGTLIKFNLDASLELRGKLKAKGTEKDSIEFTSNLSSPNSDSWKGIIVNGTNGPQGSGNQVEMDYCIGKFAQIFVDLEDAVHGPYIFKHCRFSNNHKVNYYGGLPFSIYEYCKFDSNWLGLGWCGDDAKVSHCSFINNYRGIDHVTYIDSCYFFGNTNVALAPYGTTIGCLIENNNVGVNGFNLTNSYFINNIVRNNNIGISVDFYYSDAVFINNTICDNSQYNVVNSQFNSIDLSMNCWCSTDSAYIRTTILDGYVNTNYGLVKYMPLKEECDGVSTSNKDVPENVKKEITIYPNPFKNDINLRFTSSEDVELVIIDYTGRNVLNQKVVDHSQINTESIQTGIYYYQIKTKDKILAEGKIIKIQ